MRDDGRCQRKVGGRRAEWLWRVRRADHTALWRLDRNAEGFALSAAIVRGGLRRGEQDRRRRDQHQDADENQYARLEARPHSLIIHILTQLSVT